MPVSTRWTTRFASSIRSSSPAVFRTLATSGPPGDAERRQDALADLGDRAGSIDPAEQRPALVVVDQRSRLFTVDPKTLTHDVFTIILAIATADPPHELFLWNVQEDHRVEL